jgi:hypothetical protein
VRTKRDNALFPPHKHPGKANRVFLRFPILFLLSLPSIAVAYQERLILAVQEGQCTLRIEADDEARSVRLRILPEASDCYFSKETMQSLLKKAFLKTDPPKLEGTYSSLFIGRLIDYPWLSADLACTAHEDRRWDKKTGKPVSMDINKYVATLLSKIELTARIEEPIQDCGYRIVSVNVEKVLVGGFRDVPQYKGKVAPGKVPFDAMVWFRLEKR